MTKSSPVQGQLCCREFAWSVDRILYVADQKDGLFLIGGLSDKFLAETKRMADKYTARTGS